MDNISINFAFTTESIIAILGIVVTILIAAIGGIYAIITNTKKYELTENYRKELLQWYSTVVDLMTKIIHYSECGEFNSSEFAPQRTAMLSQLSALTEVGRFYFPNGIKGDNFGSKKPSAYQGYRHINLEFMLHFYHVASNLSNSNNIALLWRLERNFTSVIFDMIEPRKRNRDYAKYLARRALSRVISPSLSAFNGKRGHSPSWIPKSTWAAGCQGCRRQGGAGPLTAR